MGWMAPVQAIPGGDTGLKRRPVVRESSVTQLQSHQGLRSQGMEGHSHSRRAVGETVDTLDGLDTCGVLNP